MKILLILVAAMALSLPCLAAEKMSALQPIYLLRNGPFFRLSSNPDESSKAPVAVFQAVCTHEWLPGLVPVFAVQTEERFELRRRPKRGQENSSEPLFFGLPNPDEPEAARIAGRWDVLAVRGDGSKAYLSWELSAEGPLVAGRFDQNTDYRFAHITGGSFRSNRLELRGEYIAEAFVLTGTWETNQVKGEWHQTNDSEHGRWEATRVYAEFKAPPNSVALYEWRNAEGKLRYAVENQFLGNDWQRNPKAICRVWK